MKRKDRVGAWPNGAKVAVMVTVLYEAWAEGEIPVHSPMVLASPMKPGTLDLQGESWARYGGETGVWRILEILGRHAVAASFCVSGRAIELFRSSIDRIVADGHEVASHAYSQDMILPYMDAAEEKTMIRRCTDLIADATGRSPVGWISPRATATQRTPHILTELGYRWHGDYNDTDLPYVIHTDTAPLVALAHSDFTDIRVITGTPRDYLDVHRDTFDFLLQSTRPEILNLSIHAHFGGRPLMAAMFEKVLEHITSSGRAWFARHDEVADWLLREARTDTPSFQEPARVRLSGGIQA